VNPESIDRFRRTEHELAQTEAANGRLAFERFPEYPGADADDVAVRAWLSAHDVRTERLDALVIRRGELLDDLRDMLGD
jgi:hypothetical protein